jgi:hypothetical protein
VEFVGLPGAGKSVLSHAVAGLLRTSGLIVDQPARDTDRLGLGGRALRKAGLALFGAAAAPLAGGRWARALLASGQRSGADSGRVALNWFYMAGLVRRISARPGVHLLDQGPVQALWSTAYASSAGRMNAAAASEALRGIVPHPTLIVLVQTGETTLASRLRHRPGGDSRLERDLRLPAGPAAYARGALALGWVEELLNQLGALGLVEVERVSGERREELSGTAELVAKRVRRLLPSGG